MINCMCIGTMICTAARLSLAFLSFTFYALGCNAQSISTSIISQEELNTSNKTLLGDQITALNSQKNESLLSGFKNVPITQPNLNSLQVVIPFSPSLESSANHNSTFLWSDNRGTWKVNSTSKPCVINSIQDSLGETCP